MSFSKEVKEELSKQISTARHCQIAEISAIISFCGNIIINEKRILYKNSHRKLDSCKKILYFNKENFSSVG